MSDRDEQFESEEPKKKRPRRAKGVKNLLGDPRSAQGSTRGALVLPGQILPPNLFVLPVQSAVVYPTMMAPLIVSEPRFIRTVEEVLKRDRLLALLLTQKGEVDRRTQGKDLYSFGVAVKIVKRIKLPDGSINILVHAIKRFKVDQVLSQKPHLVVSTKYLEDETERSQEMDALNRNVIRQVKQLSDLNPFFTDEMKLALLNAPGPGTVADLVAFALTLPKEEAQDYLETTNVKERFKKLLFHLKREHDVADMQKKINDEVNTKINTMQRDFFLKEQLKAIKKELGMEVDDKERSSRSFRERIQEARMPEEAHAAAMEELRKFETLSEHSPEYNVTRTYLETLCNLPWNEETDDVLDQERAQKILDEDHYGLERVKDRILEFLAVRELKGKEAKRKGSIICLVGPPGVGKTSIGKSIARTLDRKFYRFSLGGMRDEAEIKGHRRTYIGALPGKVINAVKRAKTRNPVLMLDEIDKIGASYQGDPASALLEVLDPEQNASFIDHYLDVPFDLSDVLFVATANSTATIPAPLLDRMEVIEIPGYTLEEKEKIANKYVIPRVLGENGLKKNQIKFEKEALRKLMSDYAREPGMRSVQQLIEKVARKAAKQLVRRKKKTKSSRIILIKEYELKDWLGPQRFYNEVNERIVQPGVVVGLAWTSMGGDILFIEATETPGTGQLKLTGKMGDVMSESANIAWTYVKRRLAEEMNLSNDDFKTKDIHLHIPAGAIPKDGPSAGITMATALYSLFTGRMAKQKFAMTGELSLTGKVLPVGGIKEKVLAAKRAGIKTIVLPELCQKDLPEVPEYALRGMSLRWVSHIDEVLDQVLLSPKKR